MAVKIHDSFAIHPGPWLREQVIKSHGMSISSAADLMKVSRSALSRVLNGKARLVPRMAMRFEEAFEISAATLLRMQASHDLAHARHASVARTITRGSNRSTTRPSIRRALIRGQYDA